MYLFNKKKGIQRQKTALIKAHSLVAVILPRSDSSFPGLFRSIALQANPGKLERSKHTAGNEDDGLDGRNVASPFYLSGSAGVSRAIRSSIHIASAAGVVAEPIK
jgi:hypothetical protein